MSITSNADPHRATSKRRASARAGLAASLASAVAAALLALAGPAQAGDLAIDLTVGQSRSQVWGGESTTLGLGVMLAYKEPGWWVYPEAGVNTRNDLFYQADREVDLGIGHAWALGPTTLHLGGGFAQLNFSNYNDTMSSSGSYLRAGLSWRVAQLGGFRMGVEARRVAAGQSARTSAFQDGSYTELALLLGWRL